MDNNLIAPSAPNGIGSKYPAPFLVLQRNCSLDKSSRITGRLRGHANESLSQSVIHRLREDDRERIPRTGLRSYDFPPRRVWRFTVRRLNLERFLKILL